MLLFACQLKANLLHYSVSLRFMDSLPLRTNVNAFAHAKAAPVSVAPVDRSSFWVFIADIAMELFLGGNLMNLSRRQSRYLAAIYRLPPQSITTD